VRELLPRGLPMGVNSRENHEEGILYFEKGDTLVIYSDGLIDAVPELRIDNRKLADRIGSEDSAREVLDELAALVPEDLAIPDDITILVVRFRGA